MKKNIILLLLFINLLVHAFNIKTALISNSPETTKICDLALVKLSSIPEFEMLERKVNHEGIFELNILDLHSI
jgi:hypothetical protein